MTKRRRPKRTLPAPVGHHVPVPPMEGITRLASIKTSSITPAKLRKLKTLVSDFAVATRRKRP